MEPRIQYARTADGVSIAFWTLGEGEPLVYMPMIPWSHVELEWRWPYFRAWYECLSKNRRLVRYDGRGCGLSDRTVDDYSVDAHVHDLEAVLEQSGLSRVALHASMHAGPVAITYAVQHPERVTHLVLYCSYARTSEYLQSPQAQTLASLRDKDWQTYTETSARVMMGWSAEEPARWLAEFYRQGGSQDTLRAFTEAFSTLDVTELLPKIGMPCLVMHVRSLGYLEVAASRHLAARIPNARLVVLEGEDLFPRQEALDEAASAIDEFLGKGEEAVGGGLTAADVHTILFTDMESSSALRRRLGDAKAQDLVRTHNTIVRDALKAHGGSEIKHTGDGIMASFPTASGALECAVAVQRGVAAHVERHPDAPLGVYIGLNAGEPISEEKDLFGTSVDLARRICDQAEPGQILVSDVVRQLAMGKGFLFSDRGDVVLRGFEDPVRLYEVRWRED